MPKKKTPDKPIVKDDPSRIIVTSMEDVMHNSMIPYAEHVILERALPRVEDGLKPVQRRILYTMLELGTTPDKPHRKCARIVGDCLGKYHPHGDSSVYDALVRMAQDFSMRGPMVDGHGNFGSIDGDGAAAMRYTEARMAPLAMQMLRDIEKDTVPFRLNFDDTLKEPDMLPARFPNLLVNGASGIAVGLATNIPPHNIGEAIRAAIAQIENPGITLDELMAIIPGPDFPTGGVLVKSDEIREGYRTGRSKLQLRARVHIEDGSAGRKLIVITEIPYGVNKAAMLEKIQRLTDEKKAALSGVFDVRDESDREGLRGIIELKRDTDPDKVLAYLYKYSDMQITFGVNMVAIADGKPVQMGLKAMLSYFIEHQKRVVTRRTEYELRQAEARAHILEGLMIAVDNLDEVIRLIRASKNPKEARTALMSAFALDEAQAQAILDMRLQRLTNLEILALRKEYEDLMKLIRSLKAILGSEKKLLGVIAKELREIGEEFADARRTSIEEIEEIKPDKTDNAPVPDEAVVVYTGAGQFKRVAPSVYRKNPLPAPDEDPREAPCFLFATRTDESLLIFTDAGNCYPLPVSALSECRPKDRGQLPAGLLPKLGEDERVIWIDCCAMKDLPSRPEILLVTNAGMLKRMPAAELDVRSKKFTVMGLRGDDRRAFVVPLCTERGGQDILLISRMAMSIRFAPDSVPQQGRTSTGVRAIQLAPGDDVLLAAQVTKGDELLLISDRGSGKRVPAMAFERQNRNGKGVRCFPFARNGANGSQLVSALRTSPDTPDLLICQVQSPPTRMPVSAVAIQPMSGKGSPLVMAILGDVVTDVIPLAAKKQDG